MNTQGPDIGRGYTETVRIKDFCQTRCPQWLLFSASRPQAFTVDNLKYPIIQIVPPEDMIWPKIIQDVYQY